MLRQLSRIAALMTPIIGILPAQTKAEDKMSFEVASVKPTTGAPVSPGFPINVGEAYRPTGGYFRADFPLSVYIEFAYKFQPAATLERDMLSHAPQWITTDTYNIEARAPISNPSKDQMRLMMQSLLADRFKLEVHFETKDVPVFALTLVKDSKPGPKLVRHADGPPCDSEASSDAYSKYMYGGGGPNTQAFPQFCDSFALIRKPNGTLTIGYRNATMEMLAGSLSGAVGQGRPVIDKTGLSGRYDFTLEWSPQPDSPDMPGPTSLEALREQLGLKVESTKAPVPILIIDKVTRPSAT